MHNFQCIINYNGLCYLWLLGDALTFTAALFTDDIDVLTDRLALKFMDHVHSQNTATSTKGKMEGDHQTSSPPINR